MNRSRLRRFAAVSLTIAFLAAPAGAASAAGHDDMQTVRGVPGWVCQVFPLLCG